jgi:hypothetical protein
MKKGLVILTLGLLLINCNSDAIEKPKNLVDKDQMIAILYDLYLVNAIKSSDITYIQKNNITSANYIFQKYKVDSLQFSQSDLYYASDVEEYEKMYQRVTQKLQEHKAAIDSLIAKNPNEEVKSEQVAPVAKPLKVRDSLRKKRFNQTTLFKDSTRN